jgi:tRNA-uridine 2-sulfurtransferase
VGQRKGLGGGFAEPYFVLEIRPETREVLVGPREELFAEGMVVEGVNWLVEALPQPGDAVRVQIRHRAPDVPATIVEGADGLELRFDDPQRAVTPGQSAVVFQGDRVLGGGRIATVRTETPVAVPA